MLDAKLPFLSFCKLSLSSSCPVFLLSLFKESTLLSMKLKDVQVVVIHHHIKELSVCTNLEKIFCCLTKCCVAHAGFCFCTKSVCVWLMTSVYSVCTVAQPCNALKTFHHNEMHFQLLYWFFVFCFGRSRQIFPAFVQVPSVPLTILTHKHMGTSVVTVKLKLSTKSVRVIHTENMMYTSFLNSLGVNCYLLKLKCTKFTFCELIILKFRICVCVCRGG